MDAGSRKVAVGTCVLRRWVQVRNRLADRVDTAGRDYVIRELGPLVCGALPLGVAGGADSRQRIVERVSRLREIPGPPTHRRHAVGIGLRVSLAPGFITGEEKRLVLPDRAAQDSAEIVPGILLLLDTAQIVGVLFEFKTLLP